VVNETTKEAFVQPIASLALTILAGRAPGASACARREAEAAQAQITRFALLHARRVHGRYGYLKPQAAQDFLAEVPGHVAAAILRSFASFHANFTVRAGDDAGAAFIATVVEHHYFTLGRKAKRAPHQLGGGTSGSIGDEGDSSADPFDRFAAKQDDRFERFVDHDWSTAPFSRADLATIESWETRDAVVLLGVTGLGRKLPPNWWAQLLRRAGATGDCSDELFDSDAARPMLAEMLGVSRGAIDQRWHRKQRLLRQLHFIRELRGEGDADRGSLALAESAMTAAVAMT
jgi:hypothetical protein